MKEATGREMSRRKRYKGLLNKVTDYLRETNYNGCITNFVAIVIGLLLAS